MSKKVLVVQLNFLGDVLVATNIVDNLKIADSDLSIDFLCYNNAFPLVEFHPNINKVWSVDDKNLRKISFLIGFIKTIRQEKYDVVIDPYSKLQTMLISLFSGANSRISYNKGVLRKLVYNKRPNPKKNLNYSGVKVIDDRISLVKTIFTNEKKWLFGYKLYLEDSTIDFVTREKYGAIGDFLVFGVLGSSLEKSYPIPYILEVLDTVRANYKGNIIFNYSPSQKEVAFSIYNQMEFKENVYPNLAGKNLREFLQILSFAEMCITNEGGLTHMSKALDIPTFSIFSIPATKESWDTMSNNKKHSSVHLFDYKKQKPYSIVDLKPNLFKEKLLEFIKINKKSNEFYTPTDY